MKIHVAIEFPDVEPLESGELANDDRAAMVLPLVHAYRRAYYHHVMPGETEPSEPLAVVLGDLLINLAHLAERIEEDPDIAAHQDEPGLMMGAETAFDKAIIGWREEVEIENFYTQQLEEETA